MLIYNIVHRWRKLTGILVLVNLAQNYRLKFYQDLIKDLSRLCSPENVVIVTTTLQHMQTGKAVITNESEEKFMHDFGRYLRAGSTTVRWDGTDASGCEVMDSFIASCVKF
jgi:hypothetical protein